VRAQRVPGDQHAICVKVTIKSPGYRLRVVDGSPHSTEHTVDYTVGGCRVLAKMRRRVSRGLALVGAGAQTGSTCLLTIHACLPTCRFRANPYCSNSSTVALNRKRP
jgi:hypothetical protein